MVTGLIIRSVAAPVHPVGVVRGDKGTKYPRQHHYKEKVKLKTNPIETSLANGRGTVDQNVFYKGVLVEAYVQQRTA